MQRRHFLLGAAAAAVGATAAALRWIPGPRPPETCRYFFPRPDTPHLGYFEDRMRPKRETGRRVWLSYVDWNTMKIHGGFMIEGSSEMTRLLADQPNAIVTYLPAQVSI